MSQREFEFVDGTSRKFWKIELNGLSHTVRFGKIGTGGQAQAKEFPSEAAAKASYEKLIAEKTKKGYVEVSRSAGGVANPTFAHALIFDDFRADFPHSSPRQRGSMSAKLCSADLPH